MKLSIWRAWLLLAWGVFLASGVPAESTTTNTASWAPSSANAGEAALSGRSPIDEPYPYVSGGTFSGQAQPASCDPLVRYRWPDPKPGDGLQIYLQHPERVDADHPLSFAGLSSLTSAKPDVTVTGTGTIRIDFGRENAGWFEIDSPDCPGDLRLSISEYNRPEYTNAGDKTGVPERIGDTWRAKFNGEYFEGVRFGFIHVDAVSKPWHITGIRLVCQVKPANYEGSFSCSDPLLDRIWQMCAYSVKVANLKDYTSTILLYRGDRNIWNGLDFWLINNVSLVALGDQAFVRQQIARVNAVPGINCGIYGYELYDVVGICDYYAMTGDISLIRECQGVITAKLERAQERWTPYIALNTPGWIAYMGEDERMGGFETVTTFNRWNYRLLCIHAWLAWAQVMDRLGDIVARDHYRQFATARIAEIRQDRSWYTQLDIHGCAEAVLAGFCSANEIAAMAAGEFGDRVTRISSCQANTGLIIEAMARANLYDDAITTLEDQWGAAIRYGGTTTFEMFYPSAADVLETNGPMINGQCGTTSLCHPWGAVACQYLNEVVAGIQATSPGFDTLDIMPHFGRRLTSVAATTPTPHGPVSVSFSVTGDIGTGHVVIPPGCIARIGCPSLERKVVKVTLVRQPTDQESPAVSQITMSGPGDPFIVNSGVVAGTYDLSVTYEGSTPPAQMKPITYPVSCLGEDRTTKGTWGGVYGKDGYVLPDFDGIGKDVRSLPAYVSAVTMAHCKHGLWASNVQDVRAPTRTADANAPRSAGSMYSGDPEATQQTMYTDITAQDGHEYTLSLYFLDWDSHNRSLGVQIIDPTSLKQLAAVQVVRDFHDGVYLSYRCTGSVRVRLDTITEPNATLSGIFFSPCSQESVRSFNR